MFHKKAFLTGVLAAALACAGTGCGSILQIRKINQQQQLRIAELEAVSERYKKDYYELKTQKEKDDARAAQKIDEAERKVEREKALGEERLREAERNKTEIARSYEKRIEERAASEAALKQQVSELEGKSQALQKGLDEAKAAGEALRKELEGVKNTLAEQEKSLANSQSDVESLNKKIEQMTQEAAATKAATEEERQKLRRDADEKVAKLKAQVDEMTSQTKQLSSSLKSMERSFKQQAEEDNALRRRVEALQTTLSSDKSSSASAKLKELEAQLGDLNDYLLKAGKNVLPPDAKSEEFYKKAQEELRPFIDKQVLSVTRDRRGVEIVIPSNSVFESPVDPIVKSDPSTAKMLSRVAALANEYPEFNVMVEGHTDSDPVRQGAFYDNLDLSMQRAANVMRKLTGEIAPSISAKRARAVGCGANHPVAPNTTAEGKSKNRRIEIVFTPVY